MGNGVGTVRVYHFGAFTVDARTGELTNAGRRVPLRDQSFQILVALLEKPGELITREELAGRLWPAGTYVDFDRGLNKAVNHLREALGDSAEQPRFIETFPRRGYRLVVPVTYEEETTTVEKVAEIYSARGGKIATWLIVFITAVVCAGIIVAGIRM